MTTDTDDPLEGADVGETRHVERSKHFHGINFEPQDFFGSDRLGDAKITNVEIVENGDGQADDFIVTWEGDVTKTLPRRWDECREPRTAEEETRARRRAWLRRAAKTASLAIPLGIATAVTYHIMSGLDLTMNGVEVGAPSITGMVGIFALMMLLGGLLEWLLGRLNGGTYP
jgi:hypothetical protein